MRKLKVRFDMPESRWIKLYIGDETGELTLDIAYTPYYLIEELIEATIKVLDKERAKANGGFNPEKYEFEFRNENEIVELQIKSFPDRRRNEALSEVLFTHRGERFEVCKSFWRGLKDLEGKCSSQTFENSYRRQFPVKNLEYLSKKISAGKIS